MTAADIALAATVTALAAAGAITAVAAVRRRRGSVARQAVVALLSGVLLLPPAAAAADWVAGDWFWRWTVAEVLAERFAADPIADRLLPAGSADRLRLEREATAVAPRDPDAVRTAFEVALRRMLDAALAARIDTVPERELLAYARAVADAALQVPDASCGDWLSVSPSTDASGGADLTVARLGQDVTEKLHAAVAAALDSPVVAGPPPPDRALAVLTMRAQERLGTASASDCVVAAVLLDEALSAPPSLRAPLVRVLLMDE